MTEVRVPKVGMSTVEVDVVEVRISKGQTVAAGEPLMDVSADKVDFTIHAETTGTVIEIRVAEGDVCEVGDIVLTIEETSA